MGARDGLGGAQMQDYVLFEFLDIPDRRQVLSKRVQEHNSAVWSEQWRTPFCVSHEIEQNALRLLIELSLGALR